MMEELEEFLRRPGGDGQKGMEREELRPDIQPASSQSC